MNFAFVIVFLAILISIGFTRSRPPRSPISSIDRLFVALVVFAALLPACVAGPLMQRSSAVPWAECVAFFVATVFAGFAPLLVAQLVHRWHFGRWWASKARTNNVV